MDNNNWRPLQGGEPPAMDWRTQLQPNHRQHVVNKIVDTLKICCTSCSPVGMHQLKKLAERYEEWIYTGATSQLDYGLKISLKRISMEKKAQNKMPDQNNRPPDQASLDSTAQTGLANGGDWQEEIYQKIKQMQEQYFFKLCEMYLRNATTLDQYDSIAHPPESDLFKRLTLYSSLLERAIMFLQITKAGIEPGYKENLANYEKQIINLINANSPRKPVTQMQQGQLQSSHMHQMQQQQSQMNQLQQYHDNQMNPQMQAMIAQGTMPTIQQNNNISTLQQNSTTDLGQGNSMNPMQQHLPEGSLQQQHLPEGFLQQQQTPGNAPSHQQQTINGISVMQPNMPNPDMIRHPIMKQEQQQQQQILQNQQQEQQAKQNQIHQLQQNEMKPRQIMGVEPAVFQQQQQQQRSNYSINQPMKAGSPFSMSSSQLLQASSSQLLQHFSPQVDQQSMLTSIPIAGTPLQSANSPFFMPSPSTPTPLSPMPGDSEKPVLVVSSLSNTAGIGGQQKMSSAVALAQSLAIGTPGISASPLFAEFSGPDGTHGNALAAVSGKSSVTELPLERLKKAVKSMFSKALSTAVSDIGLVVSMMDRIAGSAPGNGSRAADGDDLVAMTKCRLQGRNIVTQDATNGTKKMKRYTIAVPLNAISSASSVDDSFKQLCGIESAELGSTATSSFKRPKLQANHTLWEEIKEINQRLIDTIIDISDEETDPGLASAIVEGGEGTIVKCSFTALALIISLVLLLSVFVNYV